MKAVLTFTDLNIKSNSISYNMSFKFFATYFLALVRRKDMKWMSLGEQNNLKFKHELLSDLITGLVFHGC